MSDQLPNNTAIKEQSFSLPDQVLVALSIPGIDPARFREVIKAFGCLPDEGKVELAKRLIDARSQYLYHRISLAHDTSRPANSRRHLEDIGSTARQLLRLLYRDIAEPEPRNTDHVITGALPQLCQISSRRRPNQIWDPPQGLSLLGAMLSDLVEAGAQAEAIYPTRHQRKHGGDRKTGSSKPETILVEQLIDLYAALRDQYPHSGRPLAAGTPLYRFVRAGLTFTISTPKLPDGSDRQSFETAYMETNLPTESRTTDKAILGVFQRRASRIKREKNLI